MKKSDTALVTAKNPLTIPQGIDEDEGYEVSLRPKCLAEYIGQGKVQEKSFDFY